jgi:hypothetical protein
LNIIFEDKFFKSLKRAVSPLFNFIDYIRYDIPRGIKNIFIWAPVIWKDRQWDSYFLFKLLHKKLALMEPVLRNGHCVDGSKRADEIKICRLLAKRIADDNYHDNVFLHHERKWGELDMRFVPTEDKNYSRVEIERENAKTDKEKEQERKESNYLYKRVEQMKKQDLDYMFKLMSRKSLGWWD